MNTKTQEKIKKNQLKSSRENAEDAIIEQPISKKMSNQDLIAMLVGDQDSDDTNQPEEKSGSEPKPKEDSLQKPTSESNENSNSEKTRLIQLLTGETSEPKAEEPKAEEPKAEEPKAEEPKAEEPKAEEPKAEELKTSSKKTSSKKTSSKKTSSRKTSNKKSASKKSTSKSLTNIAKDLAGKNPSNKVPDLVQQYQNLQQSNTSNHFQNKKEQVANDVIRELVPASERFDFLNRLKSSPNFFPAKSKVNDVMLIHWNGRFGNRLHTYAYLHNRAQKLGGKVILPSDWEGTKLFNLDYELLKDDDLRRSLNQTAEEFDTLSYRMDAVKIYNERVNCDFKYCNPDNPNETYTNYNQGVVVDSVCAYHHKIFDEMNLSDILKLYEFKDEVKNLDIYKRMEDKQGTYDIAHLRRDDISNVNYKKNGGYSVISKESYMKAFKKFGYDPDKIVWTSDDWTNEWGLGNSIQSGLIERRGGWRYPEGSEYMDKIMFDWFPDFLRLYFARSVFRANSSFSFWACTLSKGRENPPRIFAPRLHKRVLYAKEETYKQETDFEFEETNSPHWLCISGTDNCDDIIFADEKN